MSTDDFAAFIARALFLDRDDPIAAWRRAERAAGAAHRAAVAALGTADRGRGNGPDVSVAGRTWINSDGRRNMPSGEVFTGPLETSAEGRIRFAIPTSPRGVEVAGIELEFREGASWSRRAPTAATRCCRRCSRPTTARARLGEIGIGTNFGVDRAIGSTLVDEKMGGTVHLALGRSYPETGGTNESAIHWDMICDLRQGGRLTADGEPILSTASSFRATEGSGRRRRGRTWP